MTRSGKEVPLPEGHAVCPRAPGVRYQRLAAAGPALVLIAAKALSIELQDLLLATLEAVCAVVNHWAVFPLARPLSYIHNRSRFQLTNDEFASLVLKAHALGKPFVKLRFLALQRRYLLAHRKQLLTDRLQALALGQELLCRVVLATGDVDAGLHERECSVDLIEKLLHGGTSLVWWLDDDTDQHTEEHCPRQSRPRGWGRAKRAAHALADAESFGVAACRAYRAGDARRAAALARIAARAVHAAGTERDAA